jgi:hypothetical protein
MIKYSIYHIPTIKIGCSNEVDIRVKNQGYTEYEILEEHTNIFVASDREMELQKEYGYAVDKVPYWKTIVFGKTAYTKTPRPNKKKVVVETIEERTIRLKQWHNDMKQRKVGCYDKQNSLKAGLVSKEKFSIPVLAYEYPSMKFIGEYTSAKDCGKKLGISNIGNIRNILKGRCKSSYGYTFNYK